MQVISIILYNNREFDSKAIPTLHALVNLNTHILKPRHTSKINLFMGLGMNEDG